MVGRTARTTSPQHQPRNKGRGILYKPSRQTLALIVSLATVLGAGYCALYEPARPLKTGVSSLHLDLTADQIRDKARALYGQDEIQWKCLDTLWTMESHWNFRAKGATTTHGKALGIAQALPAEKMKSIGLDFRSNPITQVKWGLLYIKLRYGNKACRALRWEFIYGWY